MSFRRVVPLAASAALAVVGVASAAEIEANSAVKKVTVFPDGAEVVRTLEADVAAGDSTVVVKGLPATMDASSLRLIGDPAGTLVIGPVESRAVPADSRTAPDASIALRLRELQAKCTDIKGEVETRTAEIEPIKRFVSTTEAPGRMPPADWKAKMETARNSTSCTRRRSPWR
jgi:hypothetical protein